MSYSGVIENLIKLWSKFPGIGEKSARRMIFYLIKQEPCKIKEFAYALNELAEKIHSCPICGAVTDADICSVCSDPIRDKHLICVVENEEDCVAIEQSGIFGGVYHVLGGKFSPLEDEEIPEESIERLRSRVKENNVTEVILATAPRIEGDLTAYAVQDALSDLPVKVTRLSYGLPVGGSIGFADRVTLHMAMMSRKELKEGDDFGNY